MSLRSFKIGLALIAAGFAVFAIALIAVAIRGEDTRDVVERVDSACARAAVPNPAPTDIDECARIRRQATLDQPLADACIVQRKTLKSRWFETITRCPVGGGPIVPTD